MKEKIKKMKKSTKIIILLLVLFILVLVFNPFYWLMQAQERPAQPELSKEEVLFFKKLKSTYNCDIERFYYNYTSEGYDDTLYIQKYTKIPFTYSLSLNLQKKDDTINKDSVYKISLDVKNKILHKNNNLKKITIFVNYEYFDYTYNSQYDSLILQP